jgi:hypothetical protein
MYFSTRSNKDRDRRSRQNDHVDGTTTTTEGDREVDTNADKVTMRRWSETAITRITTGPTRDNGSWITTPVLDGDRFFLFLFQF